MTRTFIILFMTCTLGMSASAQSPAERTTLVPGQPVERQIADGESHTYQVNLTAGQFVRFRLAQRAIDGVLTLTAPDGKQLVDMDLTGAGDEESLSLEVATAGVYRLSVRGKGQVELHGSYRLDATMQTQSTAEDRKRVAAEALLVEANELLKQGNKTAQQQIEKLDQALLLWRELGDTYWAAMTLSRIGTANYALNNYEKAIDYHQQALAIFRGLKHRYREGLTLSNIAICHYYLKHYDKSIDHYDQALSIFREGKNRSDEGDVLYRLSFNALGLHRYEKAIEYAEQALAIARELKDRKREADTLSNIANFYWSLGQTEKSITYGEQSLAVYRELKDRKGESKVLTNFGFTYSAMGRSEKAIEFNEQALAIIRELKDRVGEMYTLKNLGDCYYQLNRWEKAIEYYEQALALSRESKDHTEEAGAARNVEVGALLGLGQAYAALSRREKALEYYEQALAICRQLKIRLGEMYALQSLGDIYRSLGRNEKAIEYLEQALAISGEVKSRDAEATTLRGLGVAYRKIGRYEKAIEYYERALAIYRELKNRISEAEMLSFLGEAYTDLARSQKAIDHLEQALAIFRETKSRMGEGYTLYKLGLVYNGLNRPEKAVEYHEQALVISRAVYHRSMEADALYGLASAERTQGDLSASSTHIEQSLAIVESLRANEISSPELRASFLTGYQNSYQLYTDVLMRQHQADPTKGFDAVAVETNERQRARSLLDLIAESRTDLRQGVDVALLERERSLGKQLNDKAGLLTQAKPEQAGTLKKEISQLETDYERAQAAIRKASPRYAALTQPQPLKLKEIQAQLDADTVMLEYSLGAVGQEHSYVWAITRDSLTSYELPKVEVIEKSARAVYELLSARSTSKRGETAAQRQERISQAEAKLPAAARELSQTILAPVAAQLGNKRLVIVADGALQYIPFAMLPEPSVVSSQLSVAKNNGPRTTDNGQPLIVKHELVSIPSASALAIQRSELAGRQPAPKMLAVIADPVFDRSDSRFTTPETETGDKAKTQTINGDDARSIEHLAENSGDKPGVTTIRMVIPRLPFTRQEANRLMTLAPKGSSFSAIDFQANRATALDPALSQYRYLHIATHGWLDTERPGLSALVFSMVDAEGKPQNGFLRANDIYNLKLPAELVVLSACQTGLGKDIKGEGLVGLTRGFMYAGAARVVVSLWSVNDKATADLMTKFYEKMLKQGERPAAALRAAQVEMWKQKQWQSPYYWAAFTMQGEWR